MSPRHMFGIQESHSSFSATNEIGGKAKGLLFLQQHSFHVPIFYILDFETLNEINSKRLSINDIIAEWKRNFNIEEDSTWAVRSSAANEDGNVHSFAGLFTTVTHVRLNEMASAIEKVLASYLAPDKNNYNEQQHAQYGIIIQKMISAEYSGVLFSHDPSDIRKEAVHINLIPGLGENLVSGKEEAFSIVYDNKEFKYLNSDENFRGQYFQGTLQDVLKTGTQIKSDIQEHVVELVKGAKRLSQLKGHPVDVEFALADNKIFWLQVRPITTGKNESFIWDNTNAEGNYPGLTLPLSISLVTTSFHRAYRGMAIYLGMSGKLLEQNEPIFQNMSGEVNGGLYYNVTAWQKLIYQLPFGEKASPSLTKMWGMDDAAFRPEKQTTGKLMRLRLFTKLFWSFLFFKRLKRKYERNFAMAVAEFEKIDLESKTHSELCALYTSLENKLSSNWEAPLLNGFFTILFSSTLKRAIAHSKIAPAHPNFINDILFAQGDVISVTIVRAYQALIARIQNEPILKELFATHDPVLIFSKMRIADLSFFNEVIRYIDKYGDRTGEGELKMETISYKEDPIRFIAFLKENSKHETRKEKANAIRSYSEILKAEYPFNFIKRSYLKWLIRQTIGRVRDRENYRFMRTTTFAMVRKIFRAIDKDLLERNKIKDEKDSLYLVLPELLDHERSDTYVESIRVRKQNYERYSVGERATRYVQRGTAWDPVDLMNDSDSERIISGSGCCSGIVRGKVKVIAEEADDQGHAGMILVANYFEPGKINLFSQAAGIISVRGNLLSHTAILCREMGIPSIVGAKGLLTRIKDGDEIEMNGSTGKIKLLSGHE